MASATLLGAVLRGLLSRLLSIAPTETSFDVRGFHEASPEKRRLLEEHGAAFVTGFNLALAARSDDELAARASSVPLAERGFAYEGAGMALALLDLLVVGRSRRLESFLRGPGAAHVHMVHVGAGWALARLRRRPWGRLHGLDPLLRWLAVDGYGFHEGFFGPVRWVRGAEEPRHLDGYARRAFDQGLGRSLWFVYGADVDLVAAAVARFPQRRRADLWSGVGLAAAYAGAVEVTEVEHLADLAGAWRADAAQGAAFAATARLHAGNLAPHTSAACAELTGATPDQAATVVKASLRGIDRSSVHGYELWRTRIRTGLPARAGVAV